METNAEVSIQSLRFSCSEEGEVSTCRICLEPASDKNDPLIRPCKCSGSIGLTHKNCLQKWRMKTTNLENIYRCPICKWKYRITTASTVRNMLWLYLLPGLQSLCYSCCISYGIGFCVVPSKSASIAEEATWCPPFVTTRKPVPAPSSSVAECFTGSASSDSGIWGFFREIRRKYGPRISASEVNWIGVFRANKHWKRLFAGQYNLSVMAYTAEEICAVVPIDLWANQVAVCFGIVYYLPDMTHWLFTYVIWDYAPILERPLQILFTGKIFFDFTRFTFRIYDMLMKRYYTPNYMANFSEVQDLNEVEEC